MSLDVSPTYISGDHFAPLAKPKKLLSRRRTKENWGFNAKSYGGIGVLLIGKKENAARGKGLLVSREHHHVGSGIHKFHPVPQPYQVTSLMKSACRPSDQLLPAINEADMISIARESNLLTNKPVDKYSFNPIFDLFPRFDTSQDKKTMNEFLNKRKHLSAKNLEALQDITKDIYKTTSHQRDYSKPLKQNQQRQKLKKTKTLQPPLPMPGRLETSHDVSTQSHEGNPRCVVCGCLINLRDFSEGLTDISICNYCKSTGIFRVDMRRDDVKATVTSLNLPDLRRLTGSKVCNPNAATCKPDKQSLLKPSLKTRSGFTRIYASPLNYLGYYSGRHRNRLSALIRNLAQTETPEDDGKNMEPDPEIDIQPEKRINLKRITIPVSLKNKEFLKDKGVYCSDMFLSKDASLKKTSLKDILPMVYFPVSDENKTTKAEDEMEDDENKQGQSAPEIIKRYRSLAYKRYHESYPDKIPDLRESRIDAKKHFFSGYHTSVFRG